MRKMQRVVQMAAVVVAMTGCKGKEASSSAPAGSATKAAEATPITCPPGNVAQNGACVVVLTAEKVQAVAQQQSRLDELAAVLDSVEVVAAPIELVNGLRQTPEWQSIVARVPALAGVGDLVTTLDASVKQLRTFKGQLGEASGRLGNLKNELDQVMTSTGAAKQLEDVRTRVSSELRATFEPLAAGVGDAIDKGITPLTTKLTDAADMVIGACAVAKVSGGGDQLKSLCADAKMLFDRATTWVKDFRTQPAMYFDDVTAKLEKELELLVDAGTKQAIDAAQARLSSALNLPPSTGSAAAGSAK